MNKFVFPFSGEFCKDDVNECEDDICQHGGSCDNLYGSFFCNCTENYHGNYCEYKVMVEENSDVKDEGAVDTSNEIESFDDGECIMVRPVIMSHLGLGYATKLAVS